MKAPLDWLAEYWEHDLDPQQLAHQLTMSGLEVEACTEQAGHTVLDIAITPNRGDCLSVIGLIHELAALTGKKSKKLPKLTAPKRSTGAAAVKITATQLCQRYCGQVVTGLRIGPSPNWMQSRLEACGIRAINNVVDITNYVMLEMGQPLHAFDRERLSGEGVEVRLARAGETLITLDGKERKLGKEDLIIADTQGPVALAGVMGGLNSEVHDGTTSLFLESARFDPLSVRRTSRRLGLQSESSYRFERGVDWFRVRPALDRMVELLEEYAGATVVGKTTDAFRTVPKPRAIAFDPQDVARLLGGSWPMRIVETPLKRLGCTIIKKAADKWQVQVPSRRHDLSEPVDLIEEVARLNGYEQVAPEAPLRPTRVAGSNGSNGREARTKELLAAAGLAECIHYSFCSSDQLERLGAAWLPVAPALANPLSQETAYLRPTLLLSLLETAQYHQNRQMSDLRLFELRKIYRQEKRHLTERRTLSFLLAGRAVPTHWGRDAKQTDFYEAKGLTETVLRNFAGPRFEWTALPTASPYRELLHPTRSAELKTDTASLGVLGELHPERETAYRLKGPLYLVELDWEGLSRLETKENCFEPIPAFPWVERDLAVVVDEAVPAEQVQAIIKANNEDIVRNILIFDVYRGGQIPEGKKSLAFSYQIGSPKRTLQESDIEAVQNKIIESLKKKLQAGIR